MKSVRKTFPVMIFALFIIGLVSITLNHWVKSSTSVPETASIGLVSAAVVPHHNIVASQRAQFFVQLAKKIGVQNYPQTIILVSPNHYLAGQGKVQVSTHDWQLSEGSVLSDKDVIAKLISSKVVVNEPGSFFDEHGIYNILADIHNNFPQAKLVPIILENASQQQLDKLEKSLKQSCNSCLMIASVDFSHYQPAILAELHDQKTIRDLQTLNSDDLLNNAEVDSGASLDLLTMWARDHKTLHFNLVNHTNSDLLLNNPDIAGTSHIFGWYEEGDKVKPDKFASFVISKSLKVGDENRTIWGTDVVINQNPSYITGLPKVADDMVIAGKLTPDGLEFFGLPLDLSKPTQLLTGAQKQQALSKLYEPYKKFLVSSPSGDYIKIPGSVNISFDNLSPSVIESKIKLLINQKQ